MTRKRGVARVVASMLIAAERARQDAKFGPLGGMPGLSAFEVLSVLTEEVGELAQALNDRDMEAAKAELVQVAAVALCWLQTVESGNKRVLNPPKRKGGKGA